MFLRLRTENKEVAGSAAFFYLAYSECDKPTVGDSRKNVLQPHEGYDKTMTMCMRRNFGSAGDALKIKSEV